MKRKLKAPSFRDHLKKMLKNPKFKKGYKKEMETFDISVKLIRLRVKLGLTQAELAKLLGTSQSAVARMEDGSYNRFSLTTLRKIAEVTGTELEVNFRPPAEKQAA